MNVRRSLLAISLLLVLLVPLTLAPIRALALGRTVSQKVMKSVVQIVAADVDRKNNINPKWSGSGTIISADGLILTNCHVANPESMWGSDYHYDILIVAITTKSDDPPTPTYIAEVVQFDPALDLAVIRLTGYLDGSKFDAKKLNLPFLNLGDSDALEIGDTVNIFGYPGIGGETITLTSGNVSGFSREAGVTGRAWIKTDATIAGGNSGGTAVDDTGVLIGVPTQGGSGGSGDIVDCRQIADTNGDGVIDQKDACVPMGGFINALRPINVAKPLIEAASLGMVAPSPPPPTPPPTPTGKAAVTRPIFAPAVNDAGQPVTVVDSFPTGATEIYFFFDYNNFQDGASWQPVLSIDGEVISDVWPLANWSGGLKGTWWISIQNDPLPDGQYEFALYYDGQKLTSARVKVGGKAQTTPSFSNLTFSGGGQEGFILPGGIDQVEATFDFANVTGQTKWTYAWYYEGQKVSGGNGQAFTKTSGQATATLSNAKGFDAGSYRLELSVDNKLAATSDFAVGGKSDIGIGGDLFGPITFAEGADKNDKPVRPGTAFDSGLTALYAFFDYQAMQDGLDWTRRWYIDGKLVVDTSDSWQGGESGNWWVSVNNGDSALPDGEYKLELLVGSQMVQSGSATIGQGSGPGPTPTPQGDVEIQGQITDASTGKGIKGAVFIVLKPGITIDQFQWTEEEVLTYAEADNNGNYALPDMLSRGETYSMIVAADGYDPIAEDGVSIPQDIESPFVLDLTLQKSK